jgi:VCBS repeat-containing protein
VQALAAGQTVQDTFTVQVADGHGGFDTKAITVNVSGTNDAPAAVADIAALTEDAQPNTVDGNLLTNDTDVDSLDTHTVSALDGGTDDGTTLTKIGTYGTLVVTKATGAYTYTLANGQANVQALADGQQVTDVFTYTDSDNHGGSSASTLTVTVTGSNDAPFAVADVAAATEDALPNTVNGNVLTNDTDVDSTDTHTVSALDGGTDDGTTLTKVGTYGTLVITKATGTYTYTLANGQANVQALADGQQVTEVFTYTDADNHGGSSASALTVTVTGSNDAPVAVVDVAALTEDAQPNTVDGNLLTNDTDVDSTDTHSVSALSGGTDDGTTLTKVGTYGTLVITKATGAYTYTLANGQANVQALADGQQVTDVFTYTNADNHGGSSASTLTLTVSGSNDAPVAVADVAAATEDALPNTVDGNLLTNDIDVDNGDAHTVSALDGATDDGTTLTKVGAYGTLAITKATGAYTYTLANGQANVQALADGQQVTDVFTYTNADNHGGSSPSTLTVTVTGSNDAPVAVVDVAALTEDAQPNTVDGNLLTNDTDVDSLDTHTVSALSGGTDDGTTLTKVGTYGTLVITKATGAYTYTLANGQANVQALADGQQVTDVFTYTNADNHGGSSPSTLTVTVTGSNEAPVAVADTAAVTEDAQPNPVSGNLLANDTDVDSGDIHTISALDGATDDGTTLTKVGAYGTLVIIKATGAYTYTLANGQANVQSLADGQQVTDVFTYTDSDNNGGSSTSTLTVTVTGSNDAPIAVADVAAVTEDTNTAAQPNPVSGNLLANDTDVDSGDAHTVSALSGGTDNGATITKVGTYGTLVITKATGAYTYTLANGQANVQALADGQQVTDVFTYTDSDNHGGSSASTLTVTVTGSNDAPVAVADVAAVKEDTNIAAQPNPVTGNLLTNDTDVDSNDTHTVSALSGGTDNGATLTKVGTYGTLVIIKATGAYTYTLANGQANVQALADGQQVTDVFTYTNADNHGGSSASTLTLTVSGSNDAPVAVADVAAVKEDTNTAARPNPVSGNLLTNDTDVDSNDTHTVSALSGGTDNGTTITKVGTYGTLVVTKATGAYTYTLANGQANVQALADGQQVTEVFTYTDSDNHGGSSASTLTVTVTAATMRRWRWRTWRR